MELEEMEMENARLLNRLEDVERAQKIIDADMTAEAKRKRKVVFMNALNQFKLRKDKHIVQKSM